MKGNKLERQFLIYREKNIRTLNSFLILTTVLGIFGTLSYAIIPGQASANSSESNIYISLLSSLGVISALILIYERGFRKIYMIYFLVIVALFSIQGYHRYRVLLPAVFILNYYLKLNKLKFPPVKYLFIGFILLIFSFPLKEIGNKIQAKESINLIKIGENSVDELMKGKSGDLSFLEQSAAMIGSMDAIHKVFYGDTYLPILFFWIPKAMWEEKPKLNQWQYDISTEGRDYGQMGQVSLLSGESYANFLYFGAFVIPFLIARFYSYLYYSYRNINVKHRGFLLLLLFNMILFQVWRDGFISLIVFPIVNYLPIVILFFIKNPKTMKILINCSNLKIGGGLQVAHSFISKIKEFDVHSFTIVYINYIKQAIRLFRLSKKM